MYAVISIRTQSKNKQVKSSATEVRVLNHGYCTKSNYFLGPVSLQLMQNIHLIGNTETP